MDEPKNPRKSEVPEGGLQSGDLHATSKLIPGLKPPITKFKAIEDISQEEVDAFIELVRKWRHEGIENESPR